MAYTKAELLNAIQTSKNNDSDPLLQSDALSHLMFELLNGGITTSPVDLSTLETLIQTTIDNQNDLEVLITTLNTLSDELNTTVTAIDGNTNDLEGLTTSLSSLVTQIDSVLDSIDAKASDTNTILTVLDSRLVSLLTSSNNILLSVDGLETLITTSNTRLQTILTNTGSILTTVNSFTALLNNIINNTSDLETQFNSVIARLDSINVDLLTLSVDVSGKLGDVISNTANIVPRLDDVLLEIGTANTNLSTVNTSVSSNGLKLDDVISILDNLDSKLAPSSIISGTIVLDNTNQLWTLPINLLDWVNGYQISMVLTTSGLTLGQSVTLEFIGSVNGGTTFCNATCDDSTLLINQNTASVTNQRSIGLTFESSTFDTIGLDVINNIGTTFSVSVAYKLYKR